MNNKENNTTEQNGKYEPADIYDTPPSMITDVATLQGLLENAYDLIMEMEEDINDLESTCEELKNRNKMLREQLVVDKIVGDCEKTKQCEQSGLFWLDQDGNMIEGESEQ